VCDLENLKNEEAMTRSWVAAPQKEKVTNFVSPDYVRRGKAIPLQAWTCAEGSRKLRLPDFKKFGT